MKYLAATAIALTFTIISSPVVADECDTMAAKIAESVQWTVQPRTPARFIPMSNGTVGASLNCGGSNGMSLQATRQMPDMPQVQDIVRAASILTEVAPANIRDGIQQCVKAAVVSVSTGDFNHQIELMKIQGLSDSEIQHAVGVAYKLATDKSVDGRKDHFADLSIGHGHIFCDLTVYGDHEWLDLNITAR
jgi:hypothetical protein